MTIGYLARSYLEMRTIIGCVREAVYVKVRNWDQLIAIYVLGKLLRLNRRFAALELQFYNSYHGNPRCDVLHCFNTTSWTKTPWVVTFETMVPRYEGVIRVADRSKMPYDRRVGRALDQMAGSSCVALVAMSDCAAKMQRKLHARYKIASLDKKLFVLHPPQKVLVDHVETKTFLKNRPSVSGVFIGKEFFRKGGWESFKATERVNNELGYDAIRLTVVSTLQYGGYAEHPDAAIMKDEFLAAVSKYSWLTHHTYIENSELLKRLPGYDFGLLPSHADTYGFSVLELQAAGLPVVTTNVRALPEINNADCGWVIPVPIDGSGEACYSTRVEVENLERCIIDQCYEVMKRIALNPAEELKDKGRRALERIKREHDPARYGQRMEEIYERRNLLP